MTDRRTLTKLCSRKTRGMNKQLLLHPLSVYMNEMWNVSNRAGERADSTSFRLLSRYISLDPKLKEHYRNLAKANSQSALARRELADQLNEAQHEYGQFAIHQSLVDAMCDTYFPGSDLNPTGILSISTRVLSSLSENRIKRHEYVARNWMASLFLKSEELTGKTLYVKLGLHRAMSNVLRTWKGELGTRKSFYYIQSKALSKLEKEYEELRSMKKEFFSREASAVKQIRDSRSNNPCFENVFRALLGRVHSRLHDASPSERARKSIQLIHQFCQKEKYV
ncbi:transcriptional regulator [Perkinsela sp. CCAP 1560/4]|nr:transcriptional regulator [Perkinsela sp. CCAP 1560/4]KNH06461.1 transcriptional regulator [Perkinsela sp. CCAP 1560/4]|eukprot:KNH03990.1 transcriptional regulator [Perkinsela sp. CCAP 1560/4]